jgi:hypothetical protein
VVPAIRLSGATAADSPRCGRPDQECGGRRHTLVIVTANCPRPVWARTSTVTALPVVASIGKAHIRRCIFMHRSPARRMLASAADRVEHAGTAEP